MKMKVMMIGFSGSGKTTYMGALYSALNQAWYNGFSLRARRESDHNNFMRIGENLDKGIYPKGTDILQDYNFSLLYNGSEVLDFDWHDYRGGALQQPDSEDFNCVISSIINSDALIIFLDMPMFYPGRERLAIRILKQVSSLVQNVTSKLPEDAIFPISFVSTKFDCIFSDDTAQSVFETSGWKQLEQLKLLVAKSKNLHGLWTATVVAKDQYLDIQYPFLFSMKYALMKKFNEMVQEHNDLVRKCDEYAAKGGFLDDVFTGLGNWFNGTNYATYNELAARAASSAQKIRSIAEDIIDGPLKKIDKQLEEDVKNNDILLQIF